MQHKVECLYTEHHFKMMYEALVETGHDIVTDHSDTQWHIDDIENILINEFGWYANFTGISKC